MPLYPYRCQSNACNLRFERIYSFAQFPRTLTCPLCGLEARRVIANGIQQSVDHIGDYDRTAYQPCAGRAFTNRREMESFMHDNSLYEIGPEDVAASAQGLRDLREARADLGEAFTGDVPGRSKVNEAVQAARAAEYERRAEDALREMSQMSEDYVDQEVGRLRAESEAYVARGASVPVARVDVPMEVAVGHPAVIRPEMQAGLNAANSLVVATS